MKGEIHNPHDNFFKSVMSDSKLAKSFLKEYLPSHLTNLIDLDTLRIEKDSFVEKRLRTHRSDLLYSTRIKGQPAYLYLLFEHKSQPERYISLQLLKYMIGIWNLAIKQGKAEGGYLPVVVPIVIYHGRKVWDISVRLGELFLGRVKGLEKYIPDFEYVVKDLSGMRDEEIRGEVILRASLLAMKYIYREEMGEKLEEIFRLVRELMEKEAEGRGRGLDYLESLLRYIVSGSDKVSIEELEDRLREIPEGGRIMPTIAEQWLKKGSEQGKKEKLKEGIREGLLEGIELGLKLKFGTEGLRIYPKVAKVKDIHTLRAIKGAIETASSITDIEKILQ